MDIVALAKQMRRFSSWLNGQEQPLLERHHVSGAMEITIDAASLSPAASFNNNRISLCADEAEMSAARLAAAVRLFEERGVDRCFAWVSPGSGMEQLRGWLSALSFTRVPWTRYPTLLHVAEPAAAVAASCEIREVDRDEIAAARESLGEDVMDGYLQTAGNDSFHHYMAFEDGRPIAAAVLVEWEAIGYLTYASTIASARRRGAQSALIARRVADARRFGCRYVISQTLTMLQESFANLQRAGFREVYEQEVYEWVRR
jgi:hypothetical protein